MTGWLERTFEIDLPEGVSTARISISPPRQYRHGGWACELEMSGMGYAANPERLRVFGVDEERAREHAVLRAIVEFEWIAEDKPGGLRFCDRPVAKSDVAGIVRMPEAADDPARGGGGASPSLMRTTDERASDA